MPHVLLVCTANICRSPVAEGLLRQQLAARKMNDWSVSSAGTWAIDARPPARYSIQLMAERDIDISGHIAQIVDEALMEQADLVLCMEQGHVEALKVEFGQAAPKVHLLSEMRGGAGYDVEDPIGKDIEQYRRMMDELSLLLEEGLPTILDLAKQNAQRPR